MHGQINPIEEPSMGAPDSVVFIVDDEQAVVEIDSWMSCVQWYNSQYTMKIVQHTKRSNGAAILRETVRSSMSRRTLGKTACAY